MSEIDTPHITDSEAEEFRPNLFTLIFRRPAEAVKWALENAPETFIHRNFVLVAVAMMLMLRIPSWITGGANPIEVMIMVLVAPAISGVMQGYIFSAVVRNFAQWFFQKKIHKIEMRTVVAWSFFPFSVAYGAALLVYLVLFLFRSPEQMEKVFTGTSLDLVPVILLGVLFLLALFLRWRAFAFTFQISLGQAALLWIASFILAYGPALGILITYTAIYVRSMEWLKFKFGVS